MMWKFEQYSFLHIGDFDVNAKNDMFVFAGPSTTESWYPNGPRTYQHCGTQTKFFLVSFDLALWHWSDGYAIRAKLRGNDASRWEYWFCRDNLTFACEANPVHPNTVYT